MEFDDSIVYSIAVFVGVGVVIDNILHHSIGKLKIGEILLSVHRNFVEPCFLQNH